MPDACCNNPKIEVKPELAICKNCACTFSLFPLLAQPADSRIKAMTYVHLQGGVRLLVKGPFTRVKFAIEASSDGYMSGETVDGALVTIWTAHVVAIEEFLG